MIFLSVFAVFEQMCLLQKKTKSGLREEQPMIFNRIDRGRLIGVYRLIGPYRLIGLLIFIFPIDSQGLIGPY